MKMWAKVLHSICNVGTHGLPDMYTFGSRASAGTDQEINQEGWLG